MGAVIYVFVSAIIIVACISMAFRQRR